VLDPIPTWTALAHRNREHATIELRNVSARLSAAGMIVDETSTAVGQAADTIVRRASEIDADLILIGASETSPGGHCFLGPVAGTVLEHAVKPVLAVRPGEPKAQFRTILCPVDQSDTSARGLANAIRFAKAFDSKLIVLGVVPAMSWISLLGDGQNLKNSIQEHEQRWRSDFEQFLTTCPFQEVPWQKEVRIGAPHQEIIASARAHNADLIVMGSTGRSGLARILLGSVTRRVIQQLPCSILTVKQNSLFEGLHEEDIRTIGMLYAEAKALQAARSYEAAAEKLQQVLYRNPFHQAALQAYAAVCDQLSRTEEAEISRRRSYAVKEMENGSYDLGGGD
jgi:nucleotide-binding universal stress UspA family protein